MLKALATGLFTRKLGRKMSGRSRNPLMRMAGMAAAGYMANKLFRNRSAKRRAPERGYATRPA